MKKSDHASTAPSQTTFEFRMEERKRLALIERAQSLSIGDSFAKVKATLGEPDVDNENNTKEGAVYGRFIYYYLARWQNDTVNEKKDEYIFIYINTDDRVRDISLKEKGREKNLLRKER